MNLTKNVTQPFSGKTSMGVHLDQNYARVMPLGIKVDSDMLNGVGLPKDE